jgi:hypothetical protein
MFPWTLSPARFAALALFLLSTMALIGQSSTAEATVSVSKPFLTMRAVVQYNGVPNSVQTALYGGEGMVMTDLGQTGQLTQVTFPAGTWINPKTSKLCYFVPTVSSLTGNLPVATIYDLVENSDGSGSFIVATGGVVERSILVESANC